MDDTICVPREWPLMLIDLLVDPDGDVRMSSALGVSARSARDLALQGIYQYSFDDLPEDIVAAIELHFRLALADLRSRVDSLLTNVTKPRLMLVKK